MKRFVWSIGIAVTIAGVWACSSPSRPDPTTTTTNRSTSVITTTTTTAATTSTATTARSTTTSSSATSSLTFTITDACNDGYGLLFKFFDETNNLLWPNATEAYFTTPGQTVSSPLACNTGAQICYGARRDRNPPDGYYWGVDIDNTKGCDSCCYTCGNFSVPLALSC